MLLSFIVKYEARVTALTNLVMCMCHFQFYTVFLSNFVILTFTLNTVLAGAFAIHLRSH